MSFFAAIITIALFFVVVIATKRVGVALAATALVLLLFLCSCAQDNYTPSTGSPEQMASTLRQCKRDAVHAYLEQRGSAGMVAGALLGGPIGGVVGSLGDTAAGGMSVNGIDPWIERCMRDKGYEGMSRG